MRSLLTFPVLVMALVLIVGGIMSSKHGATVVGIAVLGGVVYNWLERHKRRTHAGGKRA